MKLSSAILVLTLAVFTVVLTEVNAAAGPVKFLKKQNATTEPPPNEDALKGKSVLGLNRQKEGEGKTGGGSADDLKGKSVLALKRHQEGAGIIEEGNDEDLHGKSIIGLKKHDEGVAKIEEGNKQKA